MSTGNTSTLSQVKRPASAQVWAWRHNFYDFRKAKRLVEQDRTRDALQYLEGPHAQYVRARFRSIGRHDARFISALALCNAIEPIAQGKQFEPVRETTPPTNQAGPLLGSETLVIVDGTPSLVPSRWLAEYRCYGQPASPEMAAKAWNTLADGRANKSPHLPLPNIRVSRALVDAFGLHGIRNLIVDEDNPCTPPPTNQPLEIPVLHVSADIADAFGMRGLPNTVIEPAAPPRDPKVIVGVKELKDALRSLRRSIPIIDKIPKGMTDGNGREVKRIVGARRVRFESDGDSLLRLSALDYPDMPAIELTRVAINSFAHFTIDVETICQIFELSNDDNMSLCVQGSELHIRGSDSHYKLFLDDIADAYALALPSVKLTPTQWLAKALLLAAKVSKDDADTQRAFDALMKPVTPAARRKLAWAIVKAKPADANAYAARVALTQAVGIEKLQKWLTTHIGSPITLV